MGIDGNVLIIQCNSCSMKEAELLVRTPRTPGPYDQHGERHWLADVSCCAWGKRREWCIWTLTCGEDTSDCKQKLFPQSFGKRWSPQQFSNGWWNWPDRWDSPLIALVSDVANTFWSICSTSSKWWEVPPEVDGQIGCARWLCGPRARPRWWSGGRQQDDQKLSFQVSEVL